MDILFFVFGYHADGYGKHILFSAFIFIPVMVLNVNCESDSNKILLTSQAVEIVLCSAEALGTQVMYGKKDLDLTECIDFAGNQDSGWR